jgi:hypothetical protein
LGNLLETGAVWLADQVKTHASMDVVYARDLEQVPLQAMIGRTEFEIDDGSGIVERFESRDFLIQADDLVLGGSATLPEPGDRILESDGAQIFAYEVMAPGDQACWKYSDPFRKLLRIHTKHVTTVT